MLKFFVGIIIVAFCTFCGRLLSKKYRQRKLFFHELKEFNERFLSEISYYRRPIQEFVASYSYQGDFGQLIHDSFSAIEEGTQKENVLKALHKYDFLTEEEKQELQEYFLMLGRGDSSSQKAYFSSRKERLTAWTQGADTAAKQYGDLYIKLGFLCGLFVLLLIV